MYLKNVLTKVTVVIRYLNVAGHITLGAPITLCAMAVFFIHIINDWHML